MEASQFDTLALRVARLTRRRSMVRLVLGLPALVVALMGGGLDPTTVDAEDDDHGSSHRRRRRRTRHKHRRNIVRRNKKHKKRKKRKPKSKCTPRTCPANGCGPMADGCGGTLRCGCGTTKYCVDGTCQPCDVCQPEGACAFTSVQDAINATDPQLETIVVCPGTYVENAVSGSYAIYIDRNLRLVGAGDGDDPATNTILKPDQPQQAVVYSGGLQEWPETPRVTLERVRVTGGSVTTVSGFGYGLVSANAIVDLIGCTITGNATFFFAGGVNAYNTTLTLTDTRITGNTGGRAGGMWVDVGSQVTFDTLSRVTGNTANFGDGFGGIIADSATSVTLPSEVNVAGNMSSGGNPNCGGGGTFVGDGVVCTTTT